MEGTDGSQKRWVIAVLLVILGVVILAVAIITRESGLSKGIVVAALVGAACGLGFGLVALFVGIRRQARVRQLPLSTALLLGALGGLARFAPAALQVGFGTGLVVAFLTMAMGAQIVGSRSRRE